MAISEWGVLSKFNLQKISKSLDHGKEIICYYGYNPKKISTHQIENTIIRMTFRYKNVKFIQMNLIYCNFINDEWNNENMINARIFCHNEKIFEYKGYNLADFEISLKAFFEKYYRIHIIH